MADAPGIALVERLDVPVDAADVAIIGGELELWLAEQVRASRDASVFWAPHRWKQLTDWVEVRSVEQLAVLICTAIRSDNNVCFVSARAAWREDPRA